jgi:hypothetical protein
MDTQHFIKRAKEMLGEGYGDESIVYYLKEEGADISKIDSIIEIAKTEYVQEEKIKQEKKGKLFYHVWLIIGILGGLFILLVLPHLQIVVGRIFIFSLLSTIFCCVSVFFILVYNYMRRQKITRINYGLLVVFIVPGVIIHFILSFIFSTVQEHKLKSTQIEAVGHIVGGNSLEVKRLLRGGGIDFTNVTVEFETQDGQKMVVSKDISKYEFKNFYKGQEVNLVYSKDNPRNIELLTNESSIRNFKNTEEREFEPDDLIQLMMAPNTEITNKLNKINYGWKFDAVGNRWINEEWQSIISIRGNELKFIGNRGYNMTYPTKLEMLGYKMTKSTVEDFTQVGTQVFENDKYTINIDTKSIVEDKKPITYSVISITSK